MYLSYTRVGEFSVFHIYEGLSNAGYSPKIQKNGEGLKYESFSCFDYKKL